MSEDTFYIEILKISKAAEKRGYLLWQKPLTGHARIDLNVDVDFRIHLLRSTVKTPGQLQIIDRNCKAVADHQWCGPGRRVAQNQDWRINRRVTQFGGLINGSHAQIGRAIEQCRSADCYCAVPKRIRFYHRHQLYIRPPDFHNTLSIMGNSRFIDLDPTGPHRAVD